ncbi:MAG: nicotinate phosphoribosyltransferase [Candidatus Uhrbacteria bacterium]
MLSDVFRRKGEPIIQSLMDTDFYKFTMGQLICSKHPDVRVRFGFTNRMADLVQLGRIIPEGRLREELDHVRTLRFTRSELHYLRGTNEYQERMFREPYLEHLGALQMPEYDLEYLPDGNIRLEFDGKWSEDSYWEIPALEILNELRSEALLASMTHFERDARYAEGVRRLMEKVRSLRDYLGLTFIEFGSRRRWSRVWQRYVLNVLMNELPDQLIGTSNAVLAMEFGLLPSGTSAHELPMVYAALAAEATDFDDEAVRQSQQQMLDDWWELYGWGLSIALPDTYGSDAFFRAGGTFGEERLRTWKGSRPDSGDVIEYGEKRITEYRAIGVDPRAKMFLPSDGLEVPKMIALWQRFGLRIKTSFGWGTNASNDLGIKAISMVIKAIMANGRHTVKLSDNLAKAMGPPEEIHRYRRAFGYDSDFREECTY